MFTTFQEMPGFGKNPFEAAIATAKGLQAEAAETTDHSRKSLEKTMRSSKS